MIPRLYVTADLAPDAGVPLTPEQAHYLKNVLRRAEGDAVRLFNGRDGEFEGRVAALKKKGGQIELGRRRREQEREPDVLLFFAPVKRGPTEMIVQKAVEIGVAGIAPVLTARTQGGRINIERLQAIATEAAEQCERISVPIVGAPVPFPAMLENWPAGRRLIFCDEAGDNPAEAWGGDEGRAAPLPDVLLKAGGASPGAAWAILTGPEGGFSPEERAALRARDFVSPASLGPRILRADTAAIGALVLWQAALGDWGRR